MIGHWSDRIGRTRVMMAMTLLYVRRRLRLD